MREYCHPSTGYQDFPPVSVGDLQHFHMDPPAGMAHWIWSSGLDWGWLVDDQTLGLVPLMGVELHWGPSSWSGHSISMSSIVIGVRMVHCLTASPPDRKRVMPVGNVGSLPSSSSMSNQTCFLWLSSAGVGGLPCHSLLLDVWVLACTFKSLIWRHTHSLEWPDLGGLGDYDEDCLHYSGEEFWCCLDLLRPSIRNVTSMIKIILLESLLLAIWWPPLLVVPQRVIEFAKLSSPGGVSYSWRFSSNLVLLVGQPWPYMCSTPATIPSCSHHADSGKACWEQRSTPLNKLVWPLE